MELCGELDRVKFWVGVKNVLAKIWANMITIKKRSDMAVETSPEDHKIRHVELHKCLDEIIADFISHTNKMPSKTKVLELMDWSYKQTIKPTTK